MSGRRLFELVEGTSKKFWEITKPIYSTSPHRYACQLVLLPDDRFVQTWPASFKGAHSKNASNNAGIGVFERDGQLLGKLSEIERAWEPTACASDRSGRVIALASERFAAKGNHERRLVLWRTDDLIAGGKPLRVINDACEVNALVFSPDGASLLFFEDDLHRVPVEGGAIEVIKSEARMGRVTMMSVSDRGTVCISNGESAALLTMAGKKLFHVESPAFSRKEGPIPVADQAIVTPEGIVITACGSVKKRWPKNVQLRYKKSPGLESGYVGVHDAKGKLLHTQPRSKPGYVRTMALMPGRAVAVAQSGLVEMVPWPLR